MQRIKSNLAVLKLKLSFFNRKVKSPQYTRRQILFKAAQIYLCATAFDMAGAQIYNKEYLYAFGKISAYEAFYSPMILYYYFVSGICIALATWKLLELYWWGKDAVEQLHSKSECDEEYISLHKTIKNPMQSLGGETHG